MKGAISDTSIDVAARRLARQLVREKHEDEDYNFSVATLVATSYDDHGNANTIDRILALGIDVNDARGLPAGITPLYLAITQGSWKVAVKLLKHGADPYVKVHGRNLLAHALHHEGFHETDTTLLADLVPLLRKIDEEDEGTNPHFSLLDKACFNTCPKCISELLACGAVSTSELSGSPFHYTFNVNEEASDEIWSLLDCFRILVAYGGRAGVLPIGVTRLHELVLYDSVLNANNACRIAAFAILSIARTGGNTRGNGRDAMRLIAKEVWLSRMHDDWFNAKRHNKR